LPFLLGVADRAVDSFIQVSPQTVVASRLECLQALKEANLSGTKDIAEE
jgi:hypothetical protein